ncbi:sushi domain-containing protein 1 isoform X2 [Hypomesus transpacificus]|uniref:sushi domain-containing protein 1 isoform X2 n=1 Tax=Hypomesus transpacificus TaxID=137520 RepID=UPI001F07573C|nr:sushi domain-containing protein 1 isoform X2 [Hypomesus transpacificus]
MHLEMKRWGAAVVTAACLLCTFSDFNVAGQIVDVCATCHANATCEDKSDGSGKMCKCMYGFVGNGRIYCQDIDECRIPGICGEGGQCRNLQGRFNCHCQVGYKVHDGTEPFHPRQDQAFCKVIDCGDPPSVNDAVQLSGTGTHYGSVARFGCEEGFLWKSGDGTSVCGVDGQWIGPSLVCEEVDCGAPPGLPHSVMLWDNSSSMGSEVVYQCSSGYHNVGQGNGSVCTASGQWNKTAFLCQEVSCGDPVILPHTGQRWNGKTTPGSNVFYYCKKGFFIEGGANLSHCTKRGSWTKPSLSCKEIACGDPPALPHTMQVWGGRSNLGSSLFYYCKDGFYREKGNNVSFCAETGYWTHSTLSCKEVDCGAPPGLPHSVMLWDNSSSMGSEVVYQCSSGYHNVGQGNGSVCTASGQWNKTTFLCQEVDCGEPPFKPHSKMIWDHVSRINSVVYYLCDEGYFLSSGKDYIVCEKRGFWEENDLQCEEISCGRPQILPNTNMLWDNTTGLGSMVEYVCMDGFYKDTGNSLSACRKSGEWEKVTLKCKANCGPAPHPVNSEVIWHNRSAVLHGCMKGHHSWKGSNMSVCDDTGKWQEATLRCREIKPAISELAVFNDKCLRWKAEKYEEDTENYRVVFSGFRSYQGNFHDKRKTSLASDAHQLEVCLDLLPVTNYTITVTAVSARFTSTVSANTSLQGRNDPNTHYHTHIQSIGTSNILFQMNIKNEFFVKCNIVSRNVHPNQCSSLYAVKCFTTVQHIQWDIFNLVMLIVPQAPEVFYREFETPFPSLWLRRSASTLDPISYYQVFVLPLEGTLVFDCTSPKNPDFLRQRGLHGQYITAQVHLKNVGREMNFSVGDAHYYEGYYNAPLLYSTDYYIILRAVSQWREAFKHSCVLWAKVRGTSYVMMMSAVFVSAAIGLLATVVIVGYLYTTFTKTRCCFRCGQSN